MEDFFFRSERYKRNINPVGDAIRQGAKFLSLMTGDSVDTTKQFIISSIKNGKIKLRDPKVKYFHRENMEDKVVAECSLSTYINDVIKNNEILAPSFTSYIHTDKKESFIVKYIVSNVQRRNKSKKEAATAKANKDEFLATVKTNEQKYFKTSNNAVTGGEVAKGSVIHNPSGHSSLTSTARTLTSLTNANNEKLIGGNRHYRDPNLVLNNIISIITISDLEVIEKAIIKYNLKVPTVDQAMECVRKSTRHYWVNNYWHNYIRNLLDKLSPIELSAFVYVSDFYHIRKYNDDFVRTFLTKLSSKLVYNTENCLDIILSASPEILNLVHHICFSEVAGYGTKYEEMCQDGLGPLLSSVILNIYSVLEEYKDFIIAFFLTDNMPLSVAYMPEMIRDVVVLSDTDSCCVTKQEWVQWYKNEIVFSDETRALAGSVMFLATQTIIHILALFSGNINVSKKYMRTLAMKSEFFWDVMVITNVAKHYYAFPRIKEANVFKVEDYSRMEIEVKGVHFINSNTPADIRKDSEQMKIEILSDISSNKKISIFKYINRIVEMEKRVYNSLKEKKITYLRIITLKDMEAYSQGEMESFYRHHIFWDKVFSVKYGSSEEPPYPVVKISIELKNKTQLKEWLNSIEDINVKTNMINWVSHNDVTNLKSVYIPHTILLGSEMLPELYPIIDYNKIILDICNTYYITLESLGYYKPENLTLTEVCGYLSEESELN